jgi:hypothetical protein
MQITMICSIIMLPSIRHPDARKDPSSYERTYLLQYGVKTERCHVDKDEAMEFVARGTRE